jgi:predicted nucleic acid-binding Zn ribbon protein
MADVPWRPLPDPEGDPPQPLSVSLDRVLSALGSPPVATVSAVFDQWSTIVGPAIAGAAEPVALDGTTLVVKVRDGGWASQLRWMERELLVKIDDALGAGVVDRLEVRVRTS